MFSASDVIDDLQFFALDHAPTEPMEEGAQFQFQLHVTNRETIAIEIWGIAVGSR